MMMVQRSGVASRRLPPTPALPHEGGGSSKIARPRPLPSPWWGGVGGGGLGAGHLGIARHG